MYNILRERDILAAVNRILNNFSKRVLIPLTIGLTAISLSSQNNKPQQKNNNEAFYGQSSDTKKYVYSYYGKDGSLKVINPKIGQTWQSLQTDNKKLNSVLNNIHSEGEFVTDRDYIMIDQYMELADSYNKKTAGNKILENQELSIMGKKLRKGKLSPEEISKIQTPEIYEINNWSEGLDRKISYIKIIKSNNSLNSKVINELEEIGQEMGFKVAEVDINHLWLEDYSIRRHDGKTYHPADPTGIFVQQFLDEPIVTYMNTTADCDKIVAKSYLEGGNVLNTIKADGEPAAIIGRESVFETLSAMKLPKNKVNISKAKFQIAEELGLKPENITYIPQIDFHIDMYYRPLQNGVVAVPDYDEGINILKGIEFPDILNDDKKEYLSRLEEVRNLTAAKLKKAEKILTSAGYKIVKLPVFSCTSEYGPSTINYMNGICGTSPDGVKFYITNKSGIDELDKIAEKYLKNTGINKVYFVSTEEHLLMYGGIDCLTQEM